MDVGGDTDGFRRRHGWIQAATRMDGGGDDTDGWRWMEAATETDRWRGGDTDGWRRRHGMEAATRMDGGGDTDGWRRRRGWMEATTRMDGVDDTDGWRRRHG